MNSAAADLAFIHPEIVLTLAGCALMLCGAFWPGSRRAWPILSLASLALAWAVRPDLGGATRSLFSGAMEVSPFTTFIDGFLYAAMALVFLVASGYFHRDREGRGELYALILWTTVGLVLMAKATDLVVLFLGLELASLAMYVLVGWLRSTAVSQEAALKFFVTGSFASALLLYGIALLFGRSGSTRIPEIVDAVNASGSDPVVSIALFLLIAGTAFKLGLAPFHSWIPDTYQGAPTPVAALVSVAPKGAAAVVLARIVQAIGDMDAAGRWTDLIAALAVLSIVIGNLGALAQRDIKRMLAYSGIAHMGYVAIAFVVFGEGALAAVLVYVVAYAFSNVGAFAVSAAVTRGEDQPHAINDLAGLARSRPFLAFAMMIFMVSLAGVPPTAGFAGKFLVFGSAVQGDAIWLALVGIAGSLVSAGYYLRVIHTMYVRDVPTDPPRTETGFLQDLGVVAALIGVLAIGVAPGIFGTLASGAARALLGS